VWLLTDNTLVDKNFIMQDRDATDGSKVCTKQGCVDLASMAPPRRPCERPKHVAVIQCV